MSGKEEREINIDIIRVLALMLVISVHFFLWNGFYQSDMNGIEPYLMSIIRTASMSCVPLFLLISGYLLSDRNYIPVKREYFGKLGYLLFVYLICTAVLIFFRTVILHENMGIFDMIKNVLSFSQYSWYVAMYSGLYLLIPFLNLLWRYIENKKDEQIFILVLCVLGMLPSLINIGIDLIPENWVGIYPVTYYYIGAYIKRRERDIHVKTVNLIFIWVVMVLLAGSFNYMVSHKGRFAMGAWNDWGSFENIVLSVIFFLLVKRIHVTDMSKSVKKLLEGLSGLTYIAFMLSYISDIVTWKIFKDIIPVENKLLIYVPAVVFSFVLAFILAFFTDRIIKAFMKVSMKRTNKII